MITKKQFEEAYRKFSPSQYELFYIKNLSISSLFHSIIAVTLIFCALTLPFIFATIGHFFNLSKTFTYVPSFIYAGILAIAGINVLLIWRLRFKRVRKICKELKISKKQYNEVVKKYYYENYYPDIKDYINSIIPE